MTNKRNKPIDPKDRIIDAFLDEMLRDLSPPDVSQRVLDRMRAQDRVEAAVSRDQRAAVLQQPLHDSLENDIDVAVSVASRNVASRNVASRSAPTRDAASKWRLWISVAAVALIGITLGVVLLLMDRSGRDKNQDIAGSNTENRTDSNSASTDDSNRRPLTKEDPDDDSEPFSNQRDLVERPSNQQVDRLPLPPRFVRNITVASTLKSPQEIAEVIDSAVQRLRNSYDVVAVDAVAEDDWCHRVFTKVLGRTADDNEVADFKALIESIGREAAVTKLIADNRSSFSQRWSASLATQLIGPQPTTVDPDYDNLVRYMRNAVDKALPWDQIGYELVSAVGSTDTGARDFNPATGYLASLSRRFGNKLEFIANEIAHDFLQKPAGCAQCHTYESRDESGVVADRLERDDFWGLLAYLKQLEISDTEESRRLVNSDYITDPRNAGRDAPVYYTDDSERVFAVYPQFDGKPDISLSGLVAEFDRRTVLANRIAESRQWRKSVVNLVWTELLNMPLHGPYLNNLRSPKDSLNSLNERLAEQLAAHDFQIEPIIAAIVLSEPFRLKATEISPEQPDVPRLGSIAFFSRAYQKSELTNPADLALSMVATELKGPMPMPGVAARRFDFLINKKPKPDDATDNSNPLSTSDLPPTASPWAVPLSLGRQLDRIAKSQCTEQQKIEHVFYLALQRHPRSSEQEHAREIIVASHDIKLGLQEVWWALVNSREFSW